MKLWKGQVLGLVLAALALVSFAAATACAADVFTAEGRFERTLSVSGAVDLNVQTGAGSITVRTGAGGSVRVVGIIKARDSWSGGISASEKVKRLEANPPIQQTGNSIVIGKLEDRELKDNVSISYEIWTPAETKLNSSTGSGSQTIDGIRGPLEAGTGSGGINISNIGGGVNASTGSGSIEMSNIKGAVRARTGSGGIRASGVAGGFEGSTGSGSVHVTQVAEGDVNVSTGSGGIEVSGVNGGARLRTGSGSIHAEGRPKAAWNIHSSSGGITVRLPKDVGFEIYARTSSGGIYSAHEVAMQGELSKRELRGKVRGGGVLVELSTSSGGIRIE